MSEQEQSTRKIHINSLRPNPVTTIALDVPVMKDPITLEYILTKEAHTMIDRAKWKNAMEAIEALGSENTRLREQLRVASEAADPFIRIAYLMDPLNLLDSNPLQSTLPLSWPVLGDCRKLRDAFAKIKEMEENNA